MTCREFADALLDFLNGELPSERCGGIQEHLGCCPPCVVLVQTYCLTITLTRHLPCKPLPPDLERRLREAVAREGGCGSGP
jgi:hypothetical protein